jgi:hypothetical protein
MGERASFSETRPIYLRQDIRTGEHQPRRIGCAVAGHEQLRPEMANKARAESGTIVPRMRQILVLGSAR